jgi:hypothetical protein
MLRNNINKAAFTNYDTNNGFRRNVWKCRFIHYDEALRELGYF